MKYRVLLSWRLLFIISLLVGSDSWSQEITIYGEDSTTVSGVYIYSKDNQEGVLSNKKGVADLSDFGNEEIIYFNHIQYVTTRAKKSDLVEAGSIQLTIQEFIYSPVIYNHPLRYNMDKDDEPGQIERIDRDVVLIENPPTSADMLQNTGSVLVQKSQGGGGSPIIRGFEANKLLLVIDGVRMNNAIYRSGHLQNSITIDNAVLDHTEIIFGPSSSLYGSDALGGVIHFHTIDPQILGEDSTYFEGSSYVRYNSNNHGLSGHFDFSTGKKNWAILTSVTASQFGDIIMGKNRSLHGDSNWGLHPYYAGNIDGNDTMLLNSNQNEQLGTGYSQIDFMEKFKYKMNNRLDLTLNFQYSTSSKINRYDKLTEYNGSQLRFAEWYYGPQNRLLAQLKLDFKKRKFRAKSFPLKKSIYDNGTVSLAYQRIDEDRISRRFGSDERMSQLEDVHVYSLNMDFNKVFTKSRVLFYGLEVQHNYVNSTAFTSNISTLNEIVAQTRYPGASNYMTSGLYLEFKRKFSNQSSFTAGLRYSLVYANSQFNDTSFITLPFSEVNVFTSAPSGNIGFVMRPDTVTRIRMQATSGFRVPNIDDYGKVFEKSGVTVVPNDNIKPEYAFGAEISMERRFFKDLFSVGYSVYGTYLYNAMVQRDFQLNGQDSILYQGEMTKIQAIQNTDNALIYGVSTWLKINLTKGLSFDYTYNYTKGNDLTNDIPLEHIPPQFGKISLAYQNDKINTALYSFYNFRKRAVDYPSGGDNIDLTPNEGGTPPWWTLNARFSYKFWDLLMVQMAAENILDVHYRQFASGISQAGRSFIGSIKVDF